MLDKIIATDGTCLQFQGRSQHRQQAKFPDYIEFQTSANKLVKQFHMRWRPHKWSILKHLPGGLEQSPQRNFSSLEIYEARLRYPMTIQAGLIVGMTTDTRVIMYQGCFAEADPMCKEITIGPGDSIIFRGDLVHAEVAFDTTNYYIECMLTVNNIECKQNSPVKALPPLRKCKYCEFLAPTRRKVQYHTRYCIANPQRETTIAKEKERNNMSEWCNDCNPPKSYPKRNTYYQH